MKTIRLTRGKEAIVDDDDFPALSKHKWHASKHLSGIFYATRTIYIGDRRTCLRMHHSVIGGKRRGMDVDHINGNPLDNRKMNLRFVSHRENGLNSKNRRNGRTTSGFPGVTWHEGKWQAQAQINGSYVYLGRFSKETDAANAYRIAVR